MKRPSEADPIERQQRPLGSWMARIAPSKGLGGRFARHHQAAREHMNISRVGVVGAGTMGAGIAEVSARSGLDTVVVEANSEALEAGWQRIEGSLARMVHKGKITDAQGSEIFSRLVFTTELDDLGDRDLVIEAIIEDESAKLELFESLDKIVPESGILASNTSSIPIINLAAATQRPKQVLGMHFFNPATIQPLVELVSSLRTSEETVAAVSAFASDTLGKHVIGCRDRAGFVVNRLLVPYLLAAIRMHDQGTSAQDIDEGMKHGCGYPMGPLALCDLIGLDTIQSVAEVLYEEFKDPSYAPPPLLMRMVSAGDYGRKSGRGFYDYG
jgi:3-hydroxybutyryl-CoA dehydrogenase